MKSLLALLLTVSPFALAQQPEPAPAPTPLAPLLVTIGDRELSDVRRWREIHADIEKAIAAGTPSVVFNIDSSAAPPQMTLPLAEEAARLSVPTLAYINTAAVGGAALFACAADHIWMAPGSRIGAAPPDLRDAGELSETAEKQLIAQALAILKAGARGLCQLKGHRPEVAEAFIDSAKELTLGTTTLATSEELLLLDANQAATPAADGKPLLAAGLAANLSDLAAKALGGQTPQRWALEKPNAKATDPTPTPTTTGPYTGKVVRIPVGEEDLISPARFEFMSRTLKRCTEEGAQAVIFDLDTPGGLAWDTTNLMMRDLQELVPPSFAFVNPRALSAGAMIAVATDAIYFAPAGSSGAATPVYAGGGELGEAERAKTNSAIMGMARTVAKQKGHDPRVIEAMIDMDRELIVNGQVLCAKGEILTLDAEQATLIVDGRPLFAKGIATSLDEVKQAEQLTGETVTAEPVGFESFAILITRYASILILIGIAGAYMEMQAPGFGLPGFISIAAFSLFFFGHYAAGSLVGHETTFAVAIFILGILLIITEFFLLPGTFIFGIIGFFCLMGALVYTMSAWDFTATPISPDSSETPVESPALVTWNLTHLGTALRNFALGLTGAIALITVLARYLPQMGPFQRLMLASTAGGTAADTPAAIATRSLHVGDIGVTRSALRPYGSVEVNGHLIEATTDSDYLNTGTPIRIRQITGSKITVEPQ